MDTKGNVTPTYGDLLSLRCRRRDSPQARKCYPDYLGLKRANHPSGSNRHSGEDVVDVKPETFCGL